MKLCDNELRDGYRALVHVFYGRTLISRYRREEFVLRNELYHRVLCFHRQLYRMVTLHAPAIDTISQDAPHHCRPLTLPLLLASPRL